MFSLADVDVLVLDNGHEPPLTWPFVEDARGLGIYAMWNRGVQAARDGGYQAVAILNDDIRIHPGTITLLAEPLLAYPTLGVVYPHWPISLDTPLPTRVKRLEQTTGTVTDGGMTGFAFVMRANLPVRFDEGYHWWYGDDAFVRDVLDAGFKIARAVGVPCEHESDSEANDWARRPDLKALVELDRERWMREQNAQ